MAWRTAASTVQAGCAISKHFMTWGRTMARCILGSVLCFYLDLTLPCNYIENANTLESNASLTMTFWTYTKLKGDLARNLVQEAPPLPLIANHAV